MKTDKVEKVMGEYKAGKLKSSSGQKVTSRKQAIAGRCNRSWWTTNAWLWRWHERWRLAWHNTNTGSWMMKTDKVEKVMSEYKAGKLKSSSGQKVTSRKQAIAIGLSEQRAARKDGLMKEAKV